MEKRPSKPRSKSISTALGHKTFIAISAVEGLKLSASGRKRISGVSTSEQRRAEVLRAYMDIKKPK